MQAIAMEKKSYKGKDILRGNGIRFIENKGQITDMQGQLRPDILYVGDGGGAKIYLRKGGLSYVMTKTEGIEENEEKEKEEKENSFKNSLSTDNIQLPTLKGHRVDIDFEGGNTEANVIADSPCKGYFNYYLGHCPQGITNIKAYSKVVYEGMYKNIDIVYYGGKKEGLKYDIIVKPGGNAGDIKFKFNGADEIALVEGRLKISTGIGEVKEWIPKVYQDIRGKISDIQATYVLEGTTLSFKLSAFNSQYPLIIDPWITYYGGSDFDASSSVSTDGGGNVLLTGVTASIDFPLTPGAFQTNIAGTNDAFCLKFDPSGTLLWTTYFGGSGDDGGSGVATDGNDNVLITGFTSSNDFPTALACQSVFGGGPHDAFVVKFDNNGALLWATYYGGNDFDRAYAIATDGSDNVLMTGFTSSFNFPTTSACQATYGGGPTDIMVVKFNSSGTPLWATYYGGKDWEEGFSITADGSDNVLITGKTYSRDFPTTAGAFQPTVVFIDGFVVKFNSSGIPLWATCYGGIGEDLAYSIATDASDNVVIVGTTGSVDFPVTAAAFQPVMAGPYDAFMVKFNSLGGRLWASYLGGSGIDEAWGVTIDGNNDIYISGDTNDSPYIINDFPVTSCAFQTLQGKKEDQYITKFNPDGNQILCSSYLGGSAYDEMDILGNISGGGIALYGEFIYITGHTDSASYPVTQGAYQTVYGGGSSDIFLAKLCAKTCGNNCGMILNTSSRTDSCVNGKSGMASVIAKEGTAPYTYSWSTTPVQTTANASGLSPGKYSVTVNDAAICNNPQTIFVTVGEPTVECGELFIPNAFTPDGDNLNDKFDIYGLDIKQFNIKIFNRWGQLIYETNDITKSWDGRYKGQLMQLGVYICSIKYTLIEGEEKSKITKITLLR